MANLFSKNTNTRKDLPKKFIGWFWLIIIIVSLSSENLSRFFDYLSNNTSGKSNLDISGNAYLYLGLTLIIVVFFIASRRSTTTLKENRHVPNPNKGYIPPKTWDPVLTAKLRNLVSIFLIIVLIIWAFIYFLQ